MELLLTHPLVLLLCAMLEIQDVFTSCTHRQDSGTEWESAPPQLDPALLKLLKDMLTKAGPEQLNSEVSDFDGVPPPLDQAVNMILKGKKCRHKSQQYRSYRNVNKGGVVPLDCGRCFLSDVQAKVSLGGKCVGRTPELYSSQINCLWKRSCRLTYMPSTLISDRLDCALTPADQLDVGYNCVNTDRTPISDVIPRVNVNADRGLVRSHDRSSTSNYPNDPLMPRSLSLNIIVPESSMASRVYIQVLRYQLTSGDSLEISTPDECPLNVQSLFRRKTEIDHHKKFITRRLNFHFKIHLDSPGNTGFDVCFQWFRFDHIDPLGEFNKTVKQCQRVVNRRSDNSRRNNDMTVLDMVPTITTKSTTGIVRSHPNYPWNYPSRLGNYPRPRDPFRSFWTSVYLRLEAPKGKRLVRIIVKKLSLAKKDCLHLTGADKKVMLCHEVTTVDEFANTSSLLLNFTMKYSWEPTGSGFLIYYQWLDWKEDKDAIFEIQASVCQKRAKMRLPKECRGNRKKKIRKKNAKKNKNRRRHKDRGKAKNGRKKKRNRNTRQKKKQQP